MTAVAHAFQRDLPPMEIAKAVEDAEAPTAPAAPVKEESAEKPTTGGRWLRALHNLILGSEPRVLDSERRSANRTPGTGLTAFFWDGGRPKAHQVRDISKRGAFVESEFLWPRGTMMILTLQIGGKSPAGNGPAETIAILAEVMWSDPEGMGLRFEFLRVEDAVMLLRFLLRWKPDFTS